MAQSALLAESICKAGLLTLGSECSLGSGAACKAKTAVSVKPWGFVNSRRKSWMLSQPRRLGIALEEALLWMFPALEPDEVGKASPGELQLVERR